MKKLIILTALSAFIFKPIYGQSKNNYFVPSAYYTLGNYSNRTSSQGYSVYSLFTIDQFDYIVAGYDMLSINDPLWKYNQQMVVAGFYKNLFPFFLSVNAAYITGNFHYKPLFYQYTDYTNIYNINAKYNIDLLFVGAFYTFSNIRGYKSLYVHQTGISLDYFINNIWKIGGKLINSNLTDNRNLYSGIISVCFYPSALLSFKLSGMIGERAYYFNADNLTVFNQDNTQTGLYSIKTDISPINLFHIILSYQFSKFDAYSINYFSGGVKLKIAY